jgi:hypothetical protein
MSRPKFFRMTRSRARTVLRRYDRHPDRAPRRYRCMTCRGVLRVPAAHGSGSATAVGLAESPPRRGAMGRTGPVTLEQVQVKYRPRLHGGAVTPYLAYLDGVPVGFIQSYWATQVPHEWPDERDPGVMGIDRFLSDSDRLNRGSAARWSASSCAASWKTRVSRASRRIRARTTTARSGVTRRRGSGRWVSCRRGMVPLSS